MKIKQIIIFILISLGIIGLIHSQEIINPKSLSNDKPMIKVIAKYDDAGVTLRWGTTKSGAWYMGTQYGYLISRGEFDINKDSAKLLNYTKITENPILPWDTLKIKNVFEEDTTNKYLLIALETIYDKFRTPEDGSFIAKADELSNRYGFDLFAADMNSTAAYASGLAFLDKDIEPDKNYMYRIVMNVPDDIYKIDTAYIWVNTKYKYDSKPKPILAKGSEQEKSVAINLDREKNNKLFTAYYIERSTDGVHFKKLNDLPYVHGISEDSALYSPYITYIDSVQNYIPYYYRVTGITPFGEYGQYSDTIVLMGRDKTPAGQAREVKAKFFENEGMRVTWKFDGDYEDLSGYNVKYATEFTGPYTNLNDSLLNKSIYEYTDPNAKKLGKNFYIVETVDTAGNMQTSLQAYGEVLDSIPPEIPTGLTGKIDSTGVVTLTWDKNPEEDVIGYQVYFANDSNNVFAQVTNGPYDAYSYIDTVSIKTLTRHVYYRITAIDFKYNISEFSKIIELERPDIIPPNSPVFTNYEITENGCKISWASSTSNDVDYQVLSRKKENGKWMNLIKCGTDRTTYMDTSILPDLHYLYCIVAVDKSGLISDTINILNITSPNFKNKKSVESFTYETDDNKIVLNWSTKYKMIYAFELFRKSSDEVYQRIATIEASKNNFTDKNVKHDKAYTYLIKIIFSNGEESEFSDELNIIWN